MTPLEFIKDRKLPQALIQRGAKIPSCTLSHVLKGRRKLPRKHDERLCKFLEEKHGYKPI